MQAPGSAWRPREPLPPWAPPSPPGLRTAGARAPTPDPAQRGPDRVSGQETADSGRRAARRGPPHRLALQPQRRHVLCVPGGHLSEPRAPCRPPHPGAEAECGQWQPPRPPRAAAGQLQRRAAPSSRRGHASWGRRGRPGTLCHSFSSRGSSRPSCSAPSLRELLRSARASFLPSRPYLARMTGRERGAGGQAGPGSPARVAPLPAVPSSSHPGFLDTRDPAERMSLRATRSPGRTAARGPARQQGCPSAPPASRPGWDGSCAAGVVRRPISQTFQTKLLSPCLAGAAGTELRVAGGAGGLLATSPPPAGRRFSEGEAAVSSFQRKSAGLGGKKGHQPATPRQHGDTPGATSRPLGAQRPLWSPAARGAGARNSGPTSGAPPSPCLGGGGCARASPSPQSRPP